MPQVIACTAEYIIPCLRVAIGYGKMLVENIPAEQFAHQPHPNMNHPAFCLGHLADAANSALQLLNREDLVDSPQGWTDLFEAGSVCVEQDGRYPEKSALIEHYVARHDAVAELLPTIGEEFFQRANPSEGRFREMAPTIGAAMNFLMLFHHSVHLGQISAWRRAVGLGGVL